MKSNISINILHDVYYTSYTRLSTTNQHYYTSLYSLLYKAHFTRPTCMVCSSQPTSLLGPFVPPVSNFGSGSYSEIRRNETAVRNISLFFVLLLFMETDSYYNIRHTHRCTETHFILLLA